MKRTISSAAVLLAVAAAGAGAQGVDPRCTPTSTPPLTPQQAINAYRDVCQKSIDIYRYMFPQLGTSVAGGNATLGQGGSLGGFPHFAIGLRANGVFGTLPQVSQIQPDTSATTNSGPIPTKSQIIPMPVVDVAIGIAKGIPIGLTNVGGVDLLLSASYLPEISNTNVKLTTPSGSLKLGYGARVGILQESLLVPGIAVSYLRRDLPTVDLTATTGATMTAFGPGTGTLDVSNLTNKTSSFRVTASKNLLLFGLALGIGQDKYEGSATIKSTYASSFGTASGSVDVQQSLTRTNLFADGYFDLVVAKLVGEIGLASGGTVQTYNRFQDKKADDARVYGSVGLRLGF